MPPFDLIAFQDAFVVYLHTHPVADLLMAGTWIGIFLLAIWRRWERKQAAHAEVMRRLFAQKWQGDRERYVFGRVQSVRSTHPDHRHGLTADDRAFLAEIEHGSDPQEAA